MAITISENQMLAAEILMNSILRIILSQVSAMSDEELQQFIDDKETEKDTLIQKILNH